MVGMVDGLYIYIYIYINEKQIIFNVITTYIVG
jgi:hypothetical protein